MNICEASRDSGNTRRPNRGSLFFKYALAFAGLVSLALIVSGVIQGYFAYKEKRDDLLQLQAARASDAALRITNFLVETEAFVRSAVPQLGAGADAEERRARFERVLFRAAAIRASLTSTRAGARH